MGQGLGFEAFQIFKKCRVYKHNETWHISIDAHDDALPLLFDYKTQYYKYELWNTLRLKSANQFRMYEILKQFEYKGERTLNLTDLKRLLCIKNNEYQRYDNLKARVLEACRKALAEYTDISFTYLPAERNGKGGGITAITFYIKANKPKAPPLSLDEFMQRGKTTEESPPAPQLQMPQIYKDKNLEFLAEACDEEFSERQMRVIFDVVIKAVPFTICKHTMALQHYDYLRMKYNEFCYTADKKAVEGSPVRNRFAYFLSTLKAETAF
ncbi:MAG: replication initiation protein [Oscillospiraceae bacterium]|nr:replication initiation protein [Oscillospiraceae bacterium]